MSFSIEKDVQPHLPKHWELRRLKEVADVIPSNVDKLSMEGQKDVLLCNYVDTYKNDRITSSIDFMKATATPAQIERLSLAKGDVTITKDSETPWDIAVPAYIAEEIEGLVCGYHLSKISPIRGRMDGGFLAWVLRCKSINLQFALISQGVTRYGLGSSALADGRIPCPPFKEQIAITAYLDTETTRIDRLIDEKTDLLGLLSELRGGIIRELTAGIHLQTTRQDTGNVFMPTVPSSWDMAGVGRFASIGNGSTPLKDNALYWEGGTYPWLNSAVVNQDEVTEGSELVTHVALKQCHLPIVPAGCVLVALTGQGKTRGQATMLRIEATINQHLAYLRPDEDRLDSEYLFWVLSGQYNALRMVSDGQGGTKGALTCEDLRRFQIPLPPLQVQKEIAARLYEDTRRVDDLVQYAKKEITVLVELRASTITDAVLGRIDVRKTKKN